MLTSNWLAFVITLVLSLIWLRLNDFAAHRGWISSQLSRKIIHAGTGPLFVLCWLLFNSDQSARYLAAIVPLGITVQFFLVGIGLISDQSAVDAMSRSGRRSEILKGPLYYGIAFIVLTVLFWKESPVGIVALMLLCGGDGLADIFGHRIASPCIPWSPKKSLVGSLSMFIGGFLFSVSVLAVFIAAGVFPGPTASYIPAILIISFVGMLVESLPLRDIDNLTVPVSAVLLGLLLF